MTSIGLLAINDIVTTARYFERAATAAGYNVLTSFDPTAAIKSNLACLLVIDPFIGSPAPLVRASCPVIGVVIDAHQQLEPRLGYARYCDHVFVVQLDYMADFAALPHASTHWLPLGCDPDIHFVTGLDRTIDVSFVGKLGRPGSVRHAILSRVLPAFDTNNYARSHTPREMGKIYSRSKIVFNKSINGDLNMRFFEGLAAGALLVTDRIGNGLDRMGTDGVHYVTYDTADEAIDKIRHYLAHDAEREAIARAGQQLVFASHTYAHRLSEILKIVASQSQARAPARDAPRSLEAIWRSEYMRMVGTPVGGALSLLAEGHLAPQVVGNVAVGVVRGLVRPLRQRLQTMSRPHGKTES